MNVDGSQNIAGCAEHQLPSGRELEAVLEAWQGATARLEQTHDALRCEVRRLTDELQVKNRELARQNRLADLGRVATHIAHEVRNNLVPVKLYMTLLRRRLTDDPGSLDVLAKVETGFSSLEAAVNDLLGFTSDRDPHYVPVRLRNLVAEVCTGLEPQTEAQGVRIQIDIPFHEMVSVDRDMIRRAVLNLVLNALDAMPDGGEIVITSYCGSNCFELEVADSGPGLSPEALRRAFEPFFTTKSGGTGLGLAIVYRIAEVHGGSVTALNCPEGGAAFTLRIPQHAMEAAA